MLNKWVKATFLIITSVSLLITGCKNGTNTTENNKKTVKINNPFPNHTQYSNDIIKPTCKSQEELDKDVKVFYDLWKKRYLKAVGGSSPIQKYVFANLDGNISVKDAVSISEGHGYGMMITVLMADKNAETKDDFDALYNFYKQHRCQDSSLMTWIQIKNGNSVMNGESKDRDSATDGDIDIAYSLLLADKQWGSDGKINYRAEALKYMEDILSNEVNLSENILLLGSWAKSNKEGNGKYLIGTRSSDFILEEIKAFEKADSANSDKWKKVYDSICNIIILQYNKQSKSTGMMPDFFIKKDNSYLAAPPNYLETEHDSDFYYNACRTPWRLSMPQIINGDKVLTKQLTTLNSWIKKSTLSNPENIKEGYKLDGNPVGSDKDLCFLAPFVVSAMIDSSNQDWLNSLYTSVNNWAIEDDTYFGNTIKMVVLIIASGNWWTPN